MAEKAAPHKADIVPVYVYVANPAAKHPVQITTWQDLIARYEEKFTPAAAGLYFRAEYNIAKQIRHRRMACLFSQPLQPRVTRQEVDNNLPLIEKFVTQLINKEVGKFVWP
jgi:hypothetical protein